MTPCDSRGPRHLTRQPCDRRRFPDRASLTESRVHRSLASASMDVHTTASPARKGGGHHLLVCLSAGLETSSGHTPHPPFRCGGPSVRWCATDGGERSAPHNTVPYRPKERFRLGAQPSHHTAGARRPSPGDRSRGEHFAIRPPPISRRIIPAPRPGRERRSPLHRHNTHRASPPRGESRWGHPSPLSSRPVSPAEATPASG